MIGSVYVPNMTYFEQVTSVSSKIFKTFRIRPSLYRLRAIPVVRAGYKFVQSINFLTAL